MQQYNKQHHKQLNNSLSEQEIERQRQRQLQRRRRRRRIQHHRISGIQKRCTVNGGFCSTSKTGSNSDYTTVVLKTNRTANAKTPTTTSNLDEYTTDDEDDDDDDDDDDN
jgi:hypothetical protein